MDALRDLGVGSDIPDLRRQDLADFDILHVFSAINGNYRIIEAARAKRLPVVISPLIQPDLRRMDGLKFRLASTLTGHISRYRLRTTYDQEMAALEGADHIIALSSEEKRVLNEVYYQSPERITVIPNGLRKEFFKADDRLFREKSGVRGQFVFVAGTVSPYKNQLKVIKATNKSGWPVVLAGPIGDQDYFAKCMKAGQGRVTHVGAFDYNDPLLASAYAAASVTVLASEGESFGLTAAESLATGTPTIITRHNGLGVEQAPPLLTFVDQNNLSEIFTAIEKALDMQRDRQSCQAIVAHMSWETVARQLIETYKHVIPNRA